MFSVLPLQSFAFMDVCHPCFYSDRDEDLVRLAASRMDRSDWRADSRAADSGAAGRAGSRADTDSRLDNQAFSFCAN